MKNNAYFNRVLVTKNNLGFAAGGQDLYSIKVRNPKNVRRVYNSALKVGGLVLWVDPATVGAVPQTIDVANITAANIGKLHIGVAHSEAKNGVVDSIREVSPGELGGCQLEELGAYGPECSLSEIKSLYPKCLNCSGLSVKITLDDNVTRGYHPLRKYEELVVNYTPRCKECDECDRTPSCDEYICGLIDAINGDLEDLQLDGLPYPGIKARSQEMPFRAVKLHPEGAGLFNAYCIAPTSGTCTECDRIDALTTFTVNGTVYNFEGVSDPADATKTLVSQLEEAAQQIEDAFYEEYGKHGGFVLITRGHGTCCGMQLYVSTCDVNFAIAGLTPCPTAITPFPTFSEAPICQDCSSTSTDTTPTCGLAIIAKQDFIDCDDCYPAQVPEYKGRHINIEVIDHEDVISTNFNKATLQKGKMASNFGTEVQYREYNQMVYGDGFNFLEGNTYSGHWGVPDKNSKLRNMVTADCSTSYCTYFLRSIVTASTFVRPEKRLFKVFGEINVPQGDAATRTAVEALYTQLATVNPQICSDLSAAVCP